MRDDIKKKFSGRRNTDITQTPAHHRNIAVTLLDDLIQPTAKLQDKQIGQNSQEIVPVVLREWSTGSG